MIYNELGVSFYGNTAYGVSSAAAPICYMSNQSNPLFVSAYFPTLLRVL